eukprot:Mycagemm_TRINITY_DN9537_c0_g1::TRINITY_DN9537_c0_g1_i1::g.1576::m.1576 type:complete len:163 gc:universal TRINITY_DN9537_c0_g1_i1:451-939(+)
MALSSIITPSAECCSNLKFAPSFSSSSLLSATCTRKALCIATSRRTISSSSPTPRPSSSPTLALQTTSSKIAPTLQTSLAPSPTPLLRCSWVSHISVPLVICGASVSSSTSCSRVAIRLALRPPRRPNLVCSPKSRTMSRPSSLIRQRTCSRSLWRKTPLSA